jgi:hypothetical protein
MVFRILALAVATVVATTAGCASLNAQAAQPAHRSASIAAGIALEKDHVVVGQKPILILTIKNVGDLKMCVSNASYLYRFHVEGKDGEPPMTEWNRHLHGDYRPGDGPALVDGPVVCQEIGPAIEPFDGMSESFKFDLTGYYDLSAAGTYSVSMEVYDQSGPQDGSGVWVRTNTAQFEMEAKAQ